MTAEFHSTILRGGNIFRPDRIIISERNITWEKRNKFLIGSDHITIPKERVSSVEVFKRFLGADIIVTSIGEGKIVARHFTWADADKIKRAIET